MTLLFTGYSVAQRFTIRLITDEVIYAEKLTTVADLFSRMTVLIIDNKRVRIDQVKEIQDSLFEFTYCTMQFRKRLHLVRRLEEGKICLYDFHSPDHRESLNARRISSNSRFYFNKPGDSVLYALNRNNFDKLFGSSFFSSYPQFQRIRKNYLRIHTSTILSAILLPNLITIIGFQSAALLIPYTATTFYLTGYSLINRQEKFKKVRQMVEDFNRENQ
ncbi:MAG TPA: hypothetical protein VFV31_10920 [Chitinophagaceae bacterium]|nr:hypothetical protein [Chitinophagaceae bacterium]